MTFGEKAALVSPLKGAANSRFLVARCRQYGFQAAKGRKFHIKTRRVLIWIAVGAGLRKPCVIVSIVPEGGEHKPRLEIPVVTIGPALSGPKVIFIFTLPQVSPTATQIFSLREKLGSFALVKIVSCNAFRDCLDLLDILVRQC